MLPNTPSRLVCLLTLSTLMAGCAYNEIRRTETVNETVSALMYRPAEQTVYALGTRYDYRARPCSSSNPKFGLPNEECLNTLNFVLSPQAAGQTLGVEITNLSVDLGSSNSIFGYYKTYLKLSPAEAAAYQARKINLVGAGKGEADRLSALLGRKVSPQGLYYTHLWFTGETVKIANKDEILKTGRLKQPLRIEVKVTEWERRRTVKPLITAPLGLVLAPVGMVLLAPYLAYGNIAGNK